MTALDEEPTGGGVLVAVCRERADGERRVALTPDEVKRLSEKGGGLSPTHGTIYGAPSAELAPGEHVAVAYARTATAATAVTRVFVVR